MTELEWRSGPNEDLDHDSLTKSEDHSEKLRNLKIGYPKGNLLQII